ncbi:Sbal_3080 family lipoprotein [Vibrio sp. 10N]|uniref:Sbal_3080 family lipoprotein n=1 Tax=Vibrio sp. 10N TaxID=3058938 RepID=UPI002813E425|nr:hypothetical protein VB10N_35080 [Vibrio sp. 10N]
MRRNYVVFVFTLLLTACSAPRYSVAPIEPSEQSDRVTIIRDDATRDIFLDSMQEWCLDTAHKCKVVSDGTPPEDNELTLTYVSRWSWDFKTFIADAKVNAYKDRKKVGEVEFVAPNNTNPKKWGNDSKRIMMMLDLLFGLESVTDAQQKIASGQM